MLAVDRYVLNRAGEKLSDALLVMTGDDAPVRTDDRVLEAPTGRAVATEREQTESAEVRCYGFVL